MSKRIIAPVIRREGLTISTLAIVVADVSDEFMDGKESCEGDALCGALTSAVTDWVNGTDEGRLLWEQSSADLNVGDLGAALPEPTLEPYLAAYGIESLSIEIVNGSDVLGWDYDTVLVEKSELSEHLIDD